MNHVPARVECQQERTPTEARTSNIDLTSYSRQRDKLREGLTLAKIEPHTEAVDELDVQGILAFAERILPHASDLWVQASLDYKQRFFTSWNQVRTVLLRVQALRQIA